MHHDAFANLDALKSKLDAHRPLAPELVRNLREDMVLRYTYHSNAIEGNTLTLMEVKVILEEGLGIGGKCCGITSKSSTMPTPSRIWKAS
ncbi:hypothetical protein SAMN05421830_112115 [Desulfomicrobium norvegicum]|uniref:Uncharacterized protein n=1 Tax=Desulfomicrobium norvegicum (strain DSM 1741 / NCIMB 8310) TaxID=52561 RepID=A0A8G2C519_DESNO|nr:hypothetical protein [Desulfomicrobium norvegicum]SFM05179.1 hypothetical protein SAMN05421830_112115 [Desulfomicrobium norvegicum]